MTIFSPSSYIWKLIFVAIAIIIMFFISKNMLDTGVAPTFEEFRIENSLIDINDVDDPHMILATSTVMTPRGPIIVEVADDDTSRSRGLGGKKDLKEDEGMLFVFQTQGIYGFWMKDMNFPIDIVWLDSEKRVVDISRDVSPEDQAEIIIPPMTVMYVLEINAGSADKFDITKGTKLFFD